MRATAAAAIARAAARPGRPPLRATSASAGTQMAPACSTAVSSGAASRKAARARQASSQTPASASAMATEREESTFGVKALSSSAVMSDSVPESAGRSRALAAGARRRQFFMMSEFITSSHCSRMSRRGAGGSGAAGGACEPRRRLRPPASSTLLRARFGLCAGPGAPFSSSSRSLAAPMASSCLGPPKSATRRTKTGERYTCSIVSSEASACASSRMQSRSASSSFASERRAAGAPPPSLAALASACAMQGAMLWCSRRYRKTSTSAPPSYLWQLASRKFGSGGPCGPESASRRPRSSGVRLEGAQSPWPERSSGASPAPRERAPRARRMAALVASSALRRAARHSCMAKVARRSRLRVCPPEAASSSQSAGSRCGRARWRKSVGRCTLHTCSAKTCSASQASIGPQTAGSTSPGCPRSAAKRPERASPARPDA